MLKQTLVHFNSRWIHIHLVCHRVSLDAWVQFTRTDVTQRLMGKKHASLSIWVCVCDEQSDRVCAVKTDSWQTRSSQFHNSITADSSVHTAQRLLDIALKLSDSAFPVTMVSKRIYSKAHIMFLDTLTCLCYLKCCLNRPTLNYFCRQTNYV